MYNGHVAGVTYWKQDVDSSGRPALSSMPAAWNGGSLAHPQHPFTSSCFINECTESAEWLFGCVSSLSAWMCMHHYFSFTYLAMK